MNGEVAVSVQILATAESVVYRNPGKDSIQLLCPENAPGAQATITRVHMAPGTVSGRHRHTVSEQIWLIEQGTGRLLLADGAWREVVTGDLVRTPIGVVHGIENTGADVLTYLSITTPPEDMGKYYATHEAPRTP
jgi:quercetin dioxygenase-like cupin family protein